MANVPTWIETGLAKVRAQVAHLFWRPSDIAGCKLWLHAGLGVKRTGSLVSSWADRTGAHVVSATEVIARPTYVKKSDRLNGRPAVHFPGTGELLEEIGDLDLPFEAEPFSAFAVASPATVGLQQGAPLLWLGEDSAVHAGLWIDATNSFRGWLEQFLESDITVMHGKPSLVGLVFDGNAAALYVNGTLVKTLPAVQAFVEEAPDAVLRLGAGAEAGDLTFHGDVGDVLVYDRALDAAEVAKLSDYLLGYYKMKSPLAPVWIDTLAHLIDLVRGAASRATRPLLTP